MTEIKFNQPYYNNDEVVNVSRALLDDKDFLEPAAELLKVHYGDAHLFLTSSATYALELIISGLFLREGDEVIMPSYNFPSAPNAVLRAGGMPVFADIDSKTLTVDIEDIGRKITKRTACIIPIHYGGVSCDMDALKILAASHRIPLVEDAALSFGGRYKGQMLGTIGDFGVLSFDSTKNLSCEKGGLAIVNTSTPEAMEALTQYYHNGTDRQAFLNGDTKEYSWKQIGMNVSMANLSAAVLCAQLKKINEIAKNRTAVYQAYEAGLKSFQTKKGFEIPTVPAYNENNAHVFYLIFKSHEQREIVRQYLYNHGIHAHTHYAPLHLSSMGRRLGFKAGDLPHTERIAPCLLRLPLHANMTVSDAEYVIESVLSAE